MQMTDSEICTSYRQALNKGKQIVVLAQLNACGEERIKKILITKGYKIEKPSKGKQGTPEWKVKQMINLYLRGYRKSEIAQTLELPQSTVDYKLTKLGYRRAKNGHSNRVRKNNPLSS